MPAKPRKHAVKSEKSVGAARPPAARPATTVVIDPFPLFRAGVVAALSAAGVPVVGEASDLGEGLRVATAAGAGTVLLGGATPAQARAAVKALPGSAVVALLADADRAEMVEMLGAGVAGLALRSLSAEALVATVRATAEAVAAPLHLAGPLVVPLAGPGPARRPAAPGSAENGLTPKEQEVLAQLARGASNKAIAEALFVTPATVKTHLAHIYAKLGAHGRKQALARALSTGRGQ